MEKFFTKTKVLIYIIIALLCFNLATVGTIYYKMKTRPGFYKERFQMNNRFGHNPDFIREKLNLTDSQMSEYQIYHELFWKKGKVLMDSMQNVRMSMFNYMTQDKPDTVKIANLNNTLGALHIELKKNTIDFYFKLKKICTPVQQDTLKNIFTRMLQFEGGLRPPHMRDREHRPKFH